MKKLINKSILLLVVLFCCNQLIQAQELLKPYHKDVSPLRAQPGLGNVHDINKLDTKNTSQYFSFLPHRGVSSRSIEPEDNYIEYTYNSPITITKIELGLPNIKSPGGNHLRIKEFRIQGSIDGVNFHPLELRKGQTYNFGPIPTKNTLILNFENSSASPVKFLRFYLVDTYAESKHQDWNAGNLVLIGYFLVYGNNIPEDKNLRLNISQIAISKGHATLIVVKDLTDAKNPKIVSSTLVDAGYNNADAIKIINVIKKEAQGRLDRIYITHVDKDHWGGLRECTWPEKATSWHCDDNVNSILALRCDPTLNLKGDPNSIFQYNTEKLELYYNEDNETSGLFQDLNNKYTDRYPVANIDHNLLRKRWHILRENPKNPDPKVQRNNAPLSLGTSYDGSPILLHTLAVNLRMNGLDLDLKTSSSKNSNGHSKNDRSGVILITWGDFSFLIQGDLEGDPSTRNKVSPETNSRIAITTRLFGGDKAAPFRLAESFENYRTHRPARNLMYTEITDDITEQSLYTNSHSQGFLRFSMDQVNFNPDDEKLEFEVKKRKLENHLKKINFKADNRDYIASVDKTRHALAKLIDNNNGPNAGYGHACIALVPHHGGPTANLWFDTDIAIIGSNNNNDHGHPKPQTMRALFNTTGVRNYYFTYLLNGPSGYNNEKNFHNYAGKLSSVNHYALNSTSGGRKGDYFNFVIKTDLRKPTNTNKRTKTISSFYNFSDARARTPIKSFSCARGH